MLYVITIFISLLWIITLTSRITACFTAEWTTCIYPFKNKTRSTFFINLFLGIIARNQLHVAYIYMVDAIFRFHESVRMLLVYSCLYVFIYLKHMKYKYRISKIQFEILFSLFVIFFFCICCVFWKLLNFSYFEVFFLCVCLLFVYFFFNFNFCFYF